jgi:hypothetical protein
MRRNVVVPVISEGGEEKQEPTQSLALIESAPETTTHSAQISGIGKISGNGGGGR